MKEDAARISEHAVVDVLTRALNDDTRGEIERVVVVAVGAGGVVGRLYSNARSEAEMCGLLWQALHLQQEAEE